MINPRATSRSSRPARPAFTLLELLVTIGAVSIVAVGLAAIFGAVGEAVAAGRRVSRLNQYARMLEAQFKSDFAGMTRDGFLVIRQQYADKNGNGSFDPPPSAANPGDDAIPLADGDLDPRPRRVDEIIFFAHGDFRTARPALPDASWYPHSDTARIYYGHGQRLAPDSADPPYENPKLNSALLAAANNGEDNLGRDGGINAKAAQWILLRHAALLSPVPTPSTYPAPFAVYNLNTAPFDSASERILRDKVCQCAGQPAAASIFRCVNATMGPNAPTPAGYTLADETQYLWYVPTLGTIGANYAPVMGASTAAFRSPMFNSGLVDIATTSLSEVRILMEPSKDPPLMEDLPDNFDPAAPRSLPRSVALNLPKPPMSPTRAMEAVDVYHAWMDNAFPAPSEDATTPDFATPFTTVNTPNMVAGARIRCEDKAVDLLDVMRPIAGATPAQSAALRADRLMLQTFNLAPACSEFVVEWSFGQVNGAGDLIWYGLPRTSAIQPYSETTNAIKFKVPHVDSTLADAEYRVPARLFYGGDAAVGNTATYRTLTSYFGAVDPIFNPDQPSGTAAAAPFDPLVQGDGKLTDPTDAAVHTEPWVWPKLIRLRVTLADPGQPRKDTEQTFEFVYEVPGGGV